VEIDATANVSETRLKWLEEVRRLVSLEPER